MKSIHTSAFSPSATRPLATLVRRFESASPASGAWLTLAALLVLMTGSLALWTSSWSTPVAAPAAVTTTYKLKPEYVVTLPPQIQDQVRGLPMTTSVEKATTRANTLGVEDIFALPQQIQEQVRQSLTDHTVAALPQDRSLRPEMISTLPWQIQNQLRGKQAGTATTVQPHPEYVVTLPWQIQDQVRGLSQERVVGATVSASSLLSPEDIMSLPPQIQDQVRRSLAYSAKSPSTTLESYAARR